MEKRTCFNCGDHLPPETEHITIENEVYCTDCVEVHSYTAYQYYLNGEYVGNSEHDSEIEFVESYEDDYEEKCD